MTMRKVATEDPDPTTGSETEPDQQQVEGSQIVQVARLRVGDRVVLSSLEHWGWVELVATDGSTATGYAYLLKLRVRCGATRRHVHVTTWRHGWETAARLSPDSASASTVAMGGPPAVS